MIYLNTAATSLHRPECVVRAVAQAMNGLGNSGRGASQEDLDASRLLFQTREAVSSMMGFSHPDHVCFTANATQAMNTALYGILSPGDTVICTDWDHNCILRPLHVLELTGVKVCVWKSDRRGRLFASDLRQLLARENAVKAVVCTHASNLTGNVLDLRAVSEAVHEREKAPLLIVDAAQTAGTLPIGMDDHGIDVLAFTGHKSLMGPQGTGGLCVRPGTAIRPLISGGTGVRSFEPFQPEEYPTHLEAGTLNEHGLAGLKSAMEWISQTGMDRIHEKEMRLAKHFVEKIRDIPGIRLYGDLDAPVRTAIVTVNLGDIPSDEVADALSVRYGIAVRAGAHCAPLMHRALGTEKQGAVRFSMGWYNTEEEIDAAAAALRELAKLSGQSDP